ncbi:mrpl36p [Saccharomyces arboricola H-6]|uniref:Mrpl36p n=1 Tax=Saccharomyces arboricola (strain H-6 / AS 2.3317 / CBS 10644) TaxID=1160507 RepID=J8Q803_SACAR|nr:mrpl36p [Saccharomyces arboricola H-6]
MLKFIFGKRFTSTGSYPGSTRITLPRRPTKKIRLGKSRPAIYHQFDVRMELSDGSVVIRRSQYPKSEIRLIQDQRNNPLWNPSRDDLVIVDANSGGSLDRFNKRYSSMFSVDTTPPSSGAGESEQPTESKKEAQLKKGEKKEEVSEGAFGMDDYLSLLDDGEQQIKSGKLASKKRDKK